MKRHNEDDKDESLMLNRRIGTVATLLVDEDSRTGKVIAGRSDITPKYLSDIRKLSTDPAIVSPRDKVIYSLSSTLGVSPWVFNPGFLKEACTYREQLSYITEGFDQLELPFQQFVSSYFEAILSIPKPVIRYMHEALDNNSMTLSSIFWMVEKFSLPSDMYIHTISKSKTDYMEMLLNISIAMGKLQSLSLKHREDEQLDLLADIETDVHENKKVRTEFFAQLRAYIMTNLELQFKDDDYNDGNRTSTGNPPDLTERYLKTFLSGEYQNNLCKIKEIMTEKGDAYIPEYEIYNSVKKKAAENIVSDDNYYKYIVKFEDLIFDINERLETIKKISGDTLDYATSLITLLTAHSYDKEFVTEFLPYVTIR